ncbi:MAG: helix-turn-helix domain-containing protein [Pseudomonadota bacterium]
MLPITVPEKIEAASCPIRNVLDQVTGKWHILILLALEDEALRFSEVKRAIGDVTQRVLTENLRGLERDGYLTRTVHAGPPLAVSYELTDRGDELVAILKPVVFWALDNLDDIKKSRATYRAVKE